MTAEVRSSRRPPSAAAGSAEQARREQATAPSVKKAGVKSTLVVARKTEGHSGAPSSSQTRCSTTPRPSTSKTKSSTSTARGTVRQGQKSDTAQQGQTARDSTANSSNPGREVEPMETTQLPSTSSAPPPEQTQKAGNASRRGRKRGASPPPPAPETLSKTRKCPLCHDRFENLRQHVEVSHLPWYFSYERSCWACRKLIDQARTRAHRCAHHQAEATFSDDMVNELGALFNGALHFLHQCLRDSAIDGLFIYVHSEGLYPSYATTEVKQFSETESRYLNLLDDRRLGVTGEISHRIYKCSPPNQFLSLTHWRVLLEILSRLSPAERENFRTYEVQMTFEGLPIGPSPIQDYGSMDFVDTHAHLDKLTKNKKVSSLDELEGVMHCRNLHLSKIVANYVYPNLWQKAQEHQSHDMCERIAYTFGIHPHFV